jgi:putative endonuclease
MTAVERSASARRRASERAGRRAESLCAFALRLKGYRVLARRMRNPAGEVDILAMRRRTLVAVEVKARADRAVAAWSLAPRQRARIERATLLFAAQRGFGQYDIRFDVMLAGGRRWPRHIVNAWTP